MLEVLVVVVVVVATVVAAVRVVELVFGEVGDLVLKERETERNCRVLT